MRHGNLCLSATQAVQTLSLDDLERQATRSPTIARCLIVGLPSLGIVASLFFGLPLFAALMAGSFLLSTALICRKALVKLTGRTLRLLVAARLVIILVLGALLLLRYRRGVDERRQHPAALAHGRPLAGPAGPARSGQAARSSTDDARPCPGSHWQPCLSQHGCQQPAVPAGCGHP